MVTRLMSPLNSIEYGFSHEPIEKILFRKLEAYFRDITVTALSYLSSILAGYLRKNCTYGVFLFLFALSLILMGSRE